MPTTTTDSRASILRLSWRKAVHQVDVRIMVCLPPGKIASGSV